MAPSTFENIFNKVKSVTKQAADTTAKQAKLAKHHLSLMTLQTEKSKFLQTIGIHVYSMYGQTKTLDPASLIEQVKDALENIERIDAKAKEIEEQIVELQEKEVTVEVQDITNTASSKDTNPSSDT